MRLPSILVPYPRAMDNHQYYNARALMRAGAARQMDQESATHETLVRNVTEILERDGVCESMRRAVGQWHRPNAADEIAERMLRVLLKGGPVPPPLAGPEGDEPEDAFSGTEQSQLSSRS
jgi:UDP-N-acetylglucosamine:LPS N-acetylglucosamine transferase